MRFQDHLVLSFKTSRNQRYRKFNFYLGPPFGSEYVLHFQMGTTGPQPNNLILANLMGLDNSDHPSLMQEIVTTMAQHMTVTDIVNGIIGDTSFLSRLQRPLTEVVRRRVLLEGRLSVEEGVQRFIDDELHPFIERFSREANTIANVDLSESLNKFLHSRLLAFCLCLLNCPNDQVS